MKQYGARLTVRLLPLLAVVLPCLVRAQVLAQLTLEEKIVSRIEKVVRTYDPFAQVQAAIQFRRVSTALPGTSLSLRDVSGQGDRGGERMSLEDIESVRVTVTTAKYPLPEWLKVRVQSEITLPGLIKSVDFKPMPDTMKADLSKVQSERGESLGVVAEESLRKLSGFLESLAASVGVRLAVALGVLVLFHALLTFGFGWMGGRSKARQWAEELGSKLGGVSGGGNAGAARARVTETRKSTAEPSVRSGGASDSGVTELPVASVEAILTDCYWTSRDGYAAWLWANLSAAQRLSLYQNRAVDLEYLKHVQGVRAVAGNDHSHPSYLSPLPIGHLSQADLATWVRRQAAAWHTLSPIRRMGLPLTLDEKVGCMRSDATVAIDLSNIPAAKSARRRLQGAADFGEISFDDERRILARPQVVPETLRSGVRSLVWLALRSPEERTALLNDYTAEELAAVWWGAPEVLARLAEIMPESRRLMMESYLAQRKPDPQGALYIELCRRGLEDKVEVAAKPENQAA